MKLISIKDACVVTGLSRTTIYKLMGTGELRAKKIGARTLFDEHELIGWISGCPDFKPKAGAPIKTYQ